MGDRLQPVLPLPAGPYRQRVLRDHRVRGARRRRLHRAARQIARRGADDAAARPVVSRDLRSRCRSCSAICTGSTRSNISRPNSPPWRVCGSGGRGVPASLIGWPDAAAERNLGEIAIPASRQPLSDAFLGRRGQRPEGLPGRPAAAGRHRLFRVPDHGRNRHADAGGGGDGVRADGQAPARWRRAGICASASSRPASASSR